MKAPRVLKPLIVYLSDWKNLLTHGLVGVALVALPLLLPLPPAGRLGVFFAIIALNLLRMRMEKLRKPAAREGSEASS